MNCLARGCMATRMRAVCYGVLAFFLTLPLVSGAAAQAPQSRAIPPQTPCAPPTATLPTRNYPGADSIPTVNALTMPSGKAVAIDGERVLLMGRVLDAACVPVIDAQVELWQNDPYGRWILASGEDLVNPAPVFAGAGRTTTNNHGEFYFITLFPAATGNRAPNFNIKIKVDDLKDFSTVLYFDGDDRNMTDPFFRRLSPFAQASVSVLMSPGHSDILNGRIDIVLPGRIKYRGY